MEYKHTGFALARMLIDYGVEYIFGIPGGQTLPLYDASYAYSNKLKHIAVRDERHAGHAACAYSRIAGKVHSRDLTSEDVQVLLNAIDSHVEELRSGTTENSA